MIKIDISELEESEVGEARHLKFVKEMETIFYRKEYLTFHKPVSINVTLVSTGDSILVTGWVWAELEVSCSRCLSPVVLSLKAPINSEYVGNLGSIGKRDKEVERRLYEDSEIDLQDEVESSLLVELPMKPLCQEDCRGLCPICGQNLNIKECDCKRETIDPRLAVLTELLD